MVGPGENFQNHGFEIGGNRYYWIISGSSAYKKRSLVPTKLRKLCFGAAGESIISPWRM